MAAPPRDEPHGSIYEPYEPYEQPGTLYGRSATVYGRTVTDREATGATGATGAADATDAADATVGDAPEPGFLGFVGVPEPVAGRHSTAAARQGRVRTSFEAAGLPAVALGLAVLAILIAGIATITGIVAVGHATSAEVAARHATDLASSAVAVADPTADQFGVPQAAAPAPTSATPAPSPSPTPSPTPSGTPDPDRLDPNANYELAYSGQVVRVQPSTCEGVGVDLDEPRVLPPIGADAAYRSCADGFHLDFDEASRYATVSDAQTTAGGCADAIRSDPGVGWVAPTPGTTVCVLTSRLAAEPQQLSTKLARVHVENVEADGTLVAALTAWVVP